MAQGETSPAPVCTCDGHAPHGHPPQGNKGQFGQQWAQSFCSLQPWLQASHEERALLPDCFGPPFPRLLVIQAFTSLTCISTLLLEVLQNNFAEKSFLSKSQKRNILSTHLPSSFKAPPQRCICSSAPQMFLILQEPPELWKSPTPPRDLCSFQRCAHTAFPTDAELWARVTWVTAGTWAPGARALNSLWTHSFQSWRSRGFSSQGGWFSPGCFPRAWPSDCLWRRLQEVWSPALACKSPSVLTQFQGRNNPEKVYSCP